MIDGRCGWLGSLLEVCPVGLRATSSMKMGANGRRFRATFLRRRSGRWRNRAPLLAMNHVGTYLSERGGLFDRQWAGCRERLVERC